MASVAASGIEMASEGRISASCSNSATKRCPAAKMASPSPGGPPPPELLQMQPSTQRSPASRTAVTIAAVAPGARVPASTTVVKPPRNASSAASLAAR